MYINKRNLCIGCMEPLGEGSTCGHCGLKQEEYSPIPRCLLPGTVLSDRYVTGKVLGEGAFGITYMGWDQMMDIPVAIKEYFPSDMVSRDVICGSGNQVYLYENEKKKDYDSYLKKFYEEAKTLSRFNQIEGIVSVRDFFYENNTAYIVMQHTGGMSVKTYVKKYGKISGGKVIEMFRPVLFALEKVHGMGIIHRDISPDNMIVREDGSLVLIDFGAARMRNTDSTKTMTVMFKRGFSPEEQYRYKGRWGAYTDVYSICATMYFMLTGEVPMDSVMRALDDDMPSLAGMREIELPIHQKKAIMKGMSVRAEDRYQSVMEFYDDLFHEIGEQNSLTTKKKRIAVAVATILVLAILIGAVQTERAKEKSGFSNGGVSADEGDSTDELAAQSISQPGVSADTRLQEEAKPALKMDSLTGLTKAKAEKILEKYGDHIRVTWKKKYSKTVKKGRVISQSIRKGSVLKEEGKPKKLTLVLSRGKEKKEVPDLFGKTQEEAIRILKEQKLEADVTWAESTRTQGTVIAQSVNSGKKVTVGTQIQITLSKGRTQAPAKNRKDDSDGFANGFAGVIQ